MYLRRIVLENIRGFSHLDFLLQRPDDSYAGWTVILGDNASGKTALLKSIAIALVGPDTTRTLQPSVTGWIRSGTRVGTIATQLVAGPDDRFAQGRRYEKPFWSEIQLKCDDDGKVLLSQGTKYLRKGKGPTRGPWAEHPEGWFCVGYGPFRRLYGHSPEAQRLMSTKGKVAQFATMFREDATLAECDLWLRQLRYRELEGDGRAKLILERVLQILNHDFLQHHSGLFHLPAPGTHEEPFQLSKEDYRRVISGKPDNIYLTPAFNMKHTRSPRAVCARKEYSLLQAKKNSRKLTAEEKQREKQLALFVSFD